MPRTPSPPLPDPSMAMELEWSRKQKGRAAGHIGQAGPGGGGVDGGGGGQPRGSGDGLWGEACGMETQRAPSGGTPGVDAAH